MLVSFRHVEHTDALTQPSQILCFTMLFNRPDRDTQKCPSREASATYAIDVPWTHATRHPVKLHLKSV